MRHRRSKIFVKAGVGGTFDTIHTGHIRLLSEAFKRASAVIIAVTSDEFARKLKPYRPRSFIERVMRLKLLVTQLARGETVIFERLDDKYGSAISDPYMDLIVVSVETLRTAFDINEKRFSRGLAPLHIAVIPIIRDGFGEKFSSRYIRTLIDEYNT